MSTVLRTKKPCWINVEYDFGSQSFGKDDVLENDWEQVFDTNLQAMSMTFDTPEEQHLWDWCQARPGLVTITYEHLHKLHHGPLYDSVDDERYTKYTLHGYGHLLFTFNDPADAMLCKLSHEGLK